MCIITIVFSYIRSEILLKVALSTINPLDPGHMEQSKQKKNHEIFVDARIALMLAKYCETIINGGVLIFVDFVAH